jgi:3'(2'), 5'-bisphosphate nucleotidase
MIDILHNIALEAGKAILKIYHNQDFSVELKADGSPLTKADNLANEIITKSLQLNLPGIPVLSEEGRNIPYSERKEWKQFFLVDPLDGTKEFIKRNGEFTVNIALINKGTPIAGVVFAPALGLLYSSYFDLKTSQWKLTTISLKLVDDHWQKISNIILKQNHNLSTSFKIVASRTHLSKETELYIEKMRQKYEKVELISMGSSLKICLVALGNADVYPRLGPTMIWDTAAAHAIALATDCTIYEYNSKNELNYNKENLVNPWFIVEKKQ